MKKSRLTKEEKSIEQALLNNEYVNVDPKVFDQIAQALVARRKDTVLSLRVNSKDLESIKKKAQKVGIKYQTFLSELIHQAAH